jgi:hypothetical protein
VQISPCNQCLAACCSPWQQLGDRADRKWARWSNLSHRRADPLVKFVPMDASHELQQLLDAGVRFSLALERNGWFSIRIGSYLSRPFATNFSPTFELAVAALRQAAYRWPLAS